MTGRGAVSQSGQGWFPQPWWLIARLRYCRPFTDLSPRSIALSHSLLQVILLATAAIIGAFSEHFSVSFVRSRSWIASFTSLREGALSERISCVKCVPNTPPALCILSPGRWMQCHRLRQAGLYRSGWQSCCSRHAGGNSAS